MSSLLLLNGSPKGERSNTNRLLSRVAQGWEGAGGTARTLHLARRAEFSAAVEVFPTAGTVVLGMPLYTDSTPALVKSFIEELAVYRGHADNPTLGYLVQSGFFEALHSRPLERYLAKLSVRLGCPYAGTIVRGGGESLAEMPEQANRKLWAGLTGLGASLAEDGVFDRALLARVAGTERLATPIAAALKLACKTPAPQFFWNQQLKANGVFDQRFAAPYGQAYTRR